MEQWICEDEMTATPKTSSLAVVRDKDGRPSTVEKVLDSRVEMWLSRSALPFGARLGPEHRFASCGSYSPQGDEGEREARRSEPRRDKTGQTSEKTLPHHRTATQPHTSMKKRHILLGITF